MAKDRAGNREDDMITLTPYVANAVRRLHAKARRLAVGAVEQDFGPTRKSSHVGHVVDLSTARRIAATQDLAAVADLIVDAVMYPADLEAEGFARKGGGPRGAMWATQRLLQFEESVDEALGLWGQALEGIAVAAVSSAGRSALLEHCASVRPGLGVAAAVKEMPVEQVSTLLRACRKDFLIAAWNECQAEGVDLTYETLEALYRPETWMDKETFSGIVRAAALLDSPALTPRSVADERAIIDAINFAESERRGLASEGNDGFDLPSPVGLLFETNPFRLVEPEKARYLAYLARLADDQEEIERLEKVKRSADGASVRVRGR